MQKLISNTILALSITLISLSALSAEVRVDSMLGLFNSLSTCNTLTDSLVYYTDTMKISIATDPDPSGYCLLSIQNIATSSAPTTTPNTPQVCKLTENDVALMTSSDAQNALAKAEAANNYQTLTKDNPSFKPLRDCLVKALDTRPRVPAPPGVTSGPTPTPPPGAVLPGAVPEGSIITAPRGTVPAPGTPYAVPAP